MSFLQLIKDPNVLVTIAFPASAGIDPPYVTGILMDDFGFSGDSNWDPDAGGLSTEALNKALSAIQQAGSLAGIGSAQYKIQSITETIATYNGTTKPKFDLQLLFVALNEDDDVRDVPRKLFKCVFPSEVRDSFLVAPLRFGLGVGFGNVQNTVAMKIGRWFQADGLVVNSVNPTWRNASLASGLPIMCTVRISLEPAKLPTADEVARWISGTFDSELVTSGSSKAAGAS